MNPYDPPSGKTDRRRWRIDMRFILFFIVGFIVGLIGTIVAAGFLLIFLTSVG